MDQTKCTDPNVLVHVAWYNMIKCVALKYSEQTKRFEVIRIFSKDFNRFVRGLIQVK